MFPTARRSSRQPFHARIRWPDVVSGWVALAFFLGCEAKPPGPAPDPKASAQPAVTPPQPKPEAQEKKKQVTLQNLPTPAQVDAVVNPQKEPIYTGPTATVRGVVRAKGDPAPVMPLKDVDKGCEMAEPMFGRLFREGPDRALADVLVAVTHYSGHLAPKTGTVQVFGEGCAWDRRTIGMDLGQYIEVIAKDRRPYVPELLGERTVAQLFALPDGDPIALVPTKLGRFVVHDSMRIYSRANVFVVGYPTFDITGIDGVFEITGIPVGKAKVGAVLPETGANVMRDIELKAGEVFNLELELSFDKKAYELHIKKAEQELGGATRVTAARP